MILAVASQKGGTGKTTTSISLAAGLAHRGKRTLIIDTDSQANSSKVLLPDYPEFTKDRTLFATIIDRKPLAISPTSIPNLDIVPSHILLSETDITLTTAIDHREARLKGALAAVKDDYDAVVIDCPPAAVLVDAECLHGRRQGAGGRLPRLLRARLDGADGQRRLKKSKPTSTPSWSLLASSSP